MKRIFVIAGLVGFGVGIAAAGLVLKDETRALRAVMSQHGFRAASVAYGEIGETPKLFTVNAQSDQIFPYFSLSKPITAAAVMEEVQRGTLRLDDQVKGATINQLLQHTGGWDQSIAGDPVTQRRGKEPCIELEPGPKQFEPGTKFAYSNMGYCLLGAVLADASGVPYRDAVNQLVPETRQMEFDPWLGPAGGWAGTAQQYFSFASHPLAAGTTLRPARDPDDIPYGLGWRVGTDGTLSHIGTLSTSQYHAAVVRRNTFVAVGLFEGRFLNTPANRQSLRNALLSFEE